MRKLIAVLLTVFICTGCLVTAGADQNKGAHSHDKWLGQVLFGENSWVKYKNNPDLVFLNNASQVCIDLMKGNTKEDSSQFTNLKGLNLYKYPSSIYDVMSPGGEAHRQFTHLGWYKSYQGTPLEDWDETWQQKRKILLGTVKKIFKFNRVIPAAVEYELGYSKKCDHFSALIYYVHILGDHRETDSPSKYRKNFFPYGYSKRESYVIPLTPKQFGYQSEDSVIPSLISHSKGLFGEKNCKTMTDELSTIQNKTETFFQIHGYANFTEQTDIDAYQNHVDEVFNCLMKHLPDILQNEQWFQKVFYP